MADRTLAVLEERLLAPDERALNLERIDANGPEALGRIEAAISSFPFLASTRVVIVRGAHDLRVADRRTLWEIAQRVPEGNVLAIEDLQPPTKKTKPETFGQLAGRGALRIDTSADEDVRGAFVREVLAALGASAEPAVVATLARGDAELAAVRTDLEKLAIGGKRIALDDLLRESLVTTEAKAYQYASALVEGRASDALAIAYELFASDRGAGIPLLSALAVEYQALWELARPGGELPSRLRWRERKLRPIARRLGAKRARAGYERAVRGFEAIVTGRAEDPRQVVESITALALPKRAAGGAAEE